MRHPNLVAKFEPLLRVQLNYTDQLEIDGHVVMYQSLYLSIVAIYSPER